MRDMGPRGDRSIRDIPVSTGNHRRSQPRFEGDVPVPRRRKSKRFLWITLSVIIIGIVAGLLLATLFAGATVTVVPKMEQITPPATIIAVPNAPSGTLGYQVVSLAQSATTTVQATGTTHVSTSASGVITISNLFSTTKQTLGSGTRFAAADGKIYRTRASVTVPGQKKNTDGSYTAGTATATVYADAPGGSYDRSSLTTFTLPAYKGSGQYTTITAKAAAGAIDGGFVGDMPSIPTADMQVAQQGLQKQLDAALRGGVGNTIPEGFLPVQGSLSITYSAISQTQSGSTTVLLSQSAHATMAAVSSTALASVLAAQLITGYADEPVVFASPNPLIIQVASTTKNVTGPLTLILQGVPTLVWQFDHDAFKYDLLGKKKAVVNSVMQKYSPAVAKVQANIRPFWKQTFPEDPAKFELVIDSQ